MGVWHAMSEGNVSIAPPSAGPAPASASIVKIEFKDDGTVWLEGVISPTAGNFTLAIARMPYAVITTDSIALGSNGKATFTPDGLKVIVHPLNLAQWDKPLKLEGVFSRK